MIREADGRESSVNQALVSMSMKKQRKDYVEEVRWWTPTECVDVGSHGEARWVGGMHVAMQDGHAWTRTREENK